MSDSRHIIQFKAATGFTVVLEYRTEEELKAVETKIQEAGLQSERLQTYNFNFSASDLYMDMRSPECIEQFDLDDWL